MKNLPSQRDINEDINGDIKWKHYVLLTHFKLDQVFNIYFSFFRPFSTKF